MRKRQVRTCEWCGKPATECKRYPCRVKCDHCRQTLAREEMEAHHNTEHRPLMIAIRMGELEREAKWSAQWAERSSTTLDWATDPHAVEYRALMREWWALPAIPEDAARRSPSLNRTLTSKGMPASSKAETQLDLMFGKRRKLTGGDWKPSREGVQTWRQQNGFDPLPASLA
jgi:hypothetical protein